MRLSESTSTNGTAVVVFSHSRNWIKKHGFQHKQHTVFHLQQIVSETQICFLVCSINLLISAFWHFNSNIQFSENYKLTLMVVSFLLSYFSFWCLVLQITWKASRATRCSAQGHLDLDTSPNQSIYPILRTAPAPAGYC